MLDVKSYRDQATEALHDVERLSPKFILDYQAGPGTLPGIFAAIPETPEFWDSGELRELKSRLREGYELAYSDDSGVKVFERRQVHGSEP